MEELSGDGVGAANKGIHSAQFPVLATTKWLSNMVHVGEVRQVYQFPKSPTTFEDSPRDVTPGRTMSSGPVREEHPYYLEIF